MIKLSFPDVLFKSNKPSGDDIDKVVQHLPKVIGDDVFSIIDAPFTEKDVKKALFQIHPSKAPGKDGFNANFFRKFWPEIGESVTREVLQVPNERGDLTSWNKTIIVLIPKMDNPKGVKDFRPISLCNTIYKLVSKAIVNRLRLVLNDIIDQFQSAFVLGRLISDNILVGFECLHWLRNCKNKKTGFAALKLDMSKAFDRVEWDYLKAVLKKLNFPENFTRLIMHCVSSVSFDFCLNGRTFGEIRPTRGLRQRDPLSPFLFVLCAQGLSSMLSEFERQNLFSGVRFSGGGPRISHLFFADDSLLFLKADKISCKNVKLCLTNYEMASGQLINFDKSSISFSPKTPPEIKHYVQDMFHIRQVQGHSLYLGLPTFSIKSKRLIFGYLRDKVSRRLADWKNKLLSAGGKEVLLKAVIQAIPTYTMACFKVPDSICSDINRLCASFWWGDSNEKRKLHWSNWNDLCRPKDRGGLGFRNLTSFNKALLAKQGWRIMYDPNLLVTQVLKSHYFRNSSFLEATVSPSASFVWKSICWGRSVISKGMMWKVGNENCIRATKDAWTPDFGMGIPLSRPDDFSKVMVSDLILRDRSWDVPKLHEIFPPVSVNAILLLPIPKTPVADICRWIFEDKGVYTVKSGYLANLDYYELLRDSFPWR